MSECTHHWTVTSECPFCLRKEIERLHLEMKQASSTWAEDKKKDEIEIERLRDVIDRAAKAWLSLHPGIAWEGDVGSAMVAAVVEIERLRQQVTLRRARLQAMRAWLRVTPWKSFLHAHPEAENWFNEDGVPR